MTKPIIIGVDTRDLRIATTGTKTYLEELCREFRLLEGKEFRFFFFDTAISVYTGKHPFLKLIEQLRFQLWKQVILPIKALTNQCDILFCTDFFVPYLQLGYKTIPVFHDAFFFEYPQHYNKIWLFLFKQLGLRAAKRSSVIIVPSFYAKERIQHYTQIETDRICCVYEAPKSLQESDNDDNQIIRQMLKGKKQGLSYILHVGSYDKRKNLPILMEAFQQLIQNGYTQFRLLLVGKSSPKKHTDATDEVSEAISRNKLEDYVIRTGYLEDSALPKVYANAFMYVFPSINEGFGLPVVESFLFDLPVLVADNTCLPEIGGDAVLTFNPYQPDDLYKKMISMIENPTLREEMIRKGRERLTLFSWAKAARELTAIFKKTTTG